MVDPLAVVPADPVAVVAVALLVAGVVGSFVPPVPGPLPSLAGVYLFWWSTGYVAPGPVLLVAFTLVGQAVPVDYLAGAVSAMAGGATTPTTVLAGVAGVVPFLFTGPVGIVLGVGGTVFLAEYHSVGRKYVKRFADGGWRIASKRYGRQ